MKEKFFTEVAALLTAAAIGLVLFFVLSFSGCPTEPRPGSTGRITIRGIPEAEGSAVSYLILMAQDAMGAAVLGGSLNPDPSGVYYAWTPIKNGMAVIELYEDNGFTALLSALRDDYPPPAPPQKVRVTGIGMVRAIYADAATGPRPSKYRVWGAAAPIRFHGNLNLRWEEGIDETP